jgi:septal ring factor EnvC (AmiA/AmiB activator)
MGRVGRLLGAAALAATLAPPATAQDTGPPTARNEAIEQQLKTEQDRALELQRQAEALALEIKSINQDLIAAAASAQDLETTLTDLERQIDELNRREAAGRAALSAQRDKMGRLLAALERLALQPPETLFLTPRAPVDTARSALLLQVALPALEDRAQALRDELQSLETLRSQIDARRQKLAPLVNDLAAEQARLHSLLERKAVLRMETEAERKATDKRMKELAAQARTVNELVERLEAEAAERAAADAAARAAEEAAAREAAERAAQDTQVAALPPRPALKPSRISRPRELRPFPTQTASLTLPARGTLEIRFGDRTATGAKSRGLTFRTRPGAQVVAPFDGKVAFAGRFRSYGQILIIKHGGKYHTLLAGLGRIDAQAGQWVLAGEPVGVMADDGNGPELYVEIRRAGRPINPLPWLAISGERAQG